MPGQPNKALRVKFEDEARAHVRIHGPSNWGPLFSRYEGLVAKRSLWRWVAALGEGEGLTAQIAAESVQEAQVAALKNIPQAPSPEYMARAGAKAHDRIDFLAALYDLWLDAEQLREFARHEKREGEDRPRIKNPHIFDLSIKRRQGLIEGAISVQREIYDLQRMRDFYDIIIEEIGKASPDVARAIMERLAELNAKHGLTIHAGDVA